MTPQATAYATALESIITAIKADSGLTSRISAAQLADGIAASRSLNAVLATVIDETGVNADGVISPEDLMAISDAVRSNAEHYSTFVTGHGDDEWNSETGFHFLQNDGGILTFQGRNMINTVIDAIYHYGFNYYDGRFVNEDGNTNELVADVAGWLNYFLNGKSYVFGTAGDDDLGSSNYSSAATMAWTISGVTRATTRSTAAREMTRLAADMATTLCWAAPATTASTSTRVAPEQTFSTCGTATMPGTPSSSKRATAAAPVPPSTPLKASNPAKT